ncbi:MAG: 4-alpha-glucanotransferase [Ilumatobacteraceae bacterium]
MTHDDWGITDGYFDVGGAWHPTTGDIRHRIREAMGVPAAGPPLWFVEAGTTHSLWNPCRLELEDGSSQGPMNDLPADLPIGYHRLIPEDGGIATILIVHPTSCPTLPRAWGAAVQIYALWSDRSWGIGDLGDLRILGQSLHNAGGRVMLISPLHQPAPSLPQENSPYYPSSRRSWNPLLLSIDGEPADELRCRPGDLIDRDAAWIAKRDALESMFSAEIDADGDALTLPTIDGPIVWSALCDRFGQDWHSWPDGLDRFDEAAIVALVDSDRSFARRLTFHAWCQAKVGEQLGEIAATGISLIGDLAVGFSPVGADAWQYQNLLALDMRLGAPPDPFNAEGQEWGIPPFIPWRLRADAYIPFVETIRAALSGVHGLRMDHVMGLFRQFWIPAGSPPSEGAYVTFPADELIAIICLEATRAGAFVVGEDLGTVAEGVRGTLSAANIAGTKVLWFESDPPAEWPANSLATLTTHDLPTVAGVLSGNDGDSNQHDRLVAAVSDVIVDVHDRDVREVIAAAHRCLLSSPATLRLVSMDDITASEQRPNHPGTTDRPNWRRRLPISVDNILSPT